MGNSLLLPQNQLMKSIKQNYTVISKQPYQILKCTSKNVNALLLRYPLIEMHEYTIHDQCYKQQGQLQSPFLVSPLCCIREKVQLLCEAANTKVTVYTQHFPCRLSSIRPYCLGQGTEDSLLSYEEGVYVLISALHGYQQLAQFGHLCYPLASAIAFNEEGQVKVWMQGNWAAHRPTQTANSEQTLVEELMHIVRERCNNFVPIDPLHHGFDQLQAVLANYIVQFHAGKAKLKQRITKMQCKDTVKRRISNKPMHRNNKMQSQKHNLRNVVDTIVPKEGKKNYNLHREIMRRVNITNQSNMINTKESTMNYKTPIKYNYTTNRTSQKSNNGSPIPPQHYSPSIQFRHHTVPSPRLPQQCNTPPRPPRQHIPIHNRPKITFMRQTIFNSPQLMIPEPALQKKLVFTNDPIPYFSITSPAIQTQKIASQYSARVCTLSKQKTMISQSPNRVINQSPYRLVLPNSTVHQSPQRTIKITYESTPERRTTHSTNKESTPRTTAQSQNYINLKTQGIYQPIQLFNNSHQHGRSNHNSNNTYNTNGNNLNINNNHHQNANFSNSNHDHHLNFNVSVEKIHTQCTQTKLNQDNFQGENDFQKQNSSIIMSQQEMVRSKNKEIKEITTEFKYLLSQLNNDKEQLTQIIQNKSMKNSYSIIREQQNESQSFDLN